MCLKYKASAYSLMELTVVLVLSGILFAMAYQALHFVQFTYTQFSAKNDNLTKNRMLMSRLKKDCLSADLITATEYEINCIGTGGTIVYKIMPLYIIRQQGATRDTFRLNNAVLRCHFGEQEIISLTPEPVDELSLVAEVQKTSVRFRITKRYGADQLFQQTLLKNSNE